MSERTHRYVMDPDRYVPLPKGWVDYVENPLDPERMRIIRCPIGAAPAWVQARHRGEDRR